MKRYLFLKLGLTILVFAAASPRTQVQENFTSNRDVNRHSNNQHDQTAGSSSQQGDPKAKLEDYQGVMGKPGVDFPILTYIPRTGFNCRGKKSGYYADLETNCQVFHICEEGRKVSFLCPNGTIFQQSDLICDWWFKVDCATAPTLYEESAEQLYEENVRRKENRRVQEQERRSSKVNRHHDNQRKQPSNSRESQANFVKKDTNQYTSHQNTNRYNDNTFHQSREEYSNSYKETQIPSETASFVNNRYNTEQQKNYFKSINDVGDDTQSYVATKTFVTNDYSSVKTTTEKLVNRGNSRGSRTYSSSFTTNKVQYRNQVPDLIKTTTQHTIYSPTVPPFTSTRYTTRSPQTTTQAYKLKSLPTTRQAVSGFYITKELKPVSTFAPFVTELPSTTSVTGTFFNQPNLVTSSPIPFTSSTERTYYSSTPATVDVTQHPLVGSELVTNDSQFVSTLDDRGTTKDFVQTTTEQNFEKFTTVFPFEDATVKNNDLPSVPTPFKTRSAIAVEDKQFNNQYTYLPKSNDSNIPTPKPTIPTEYTTLNVIPTVTENLSNMIKTLEDIDNNPAIDLDKQLGTRPGLNIPPSAGPKTLHSLAIYFATALDNLVSSNENDTLDNNEELSTTLPTIDDTHVTLLSRSTQTKYNSLFDEQVVDNTTDEPVHKKTDIDLRSLVEHDAHYNDLDSQQSRGLVSSSTPRIRQLAQVFTQALSAYLDDPDTFKKVLEEIRPTEPPLYETNPDVTLVTTQPTTVTTEYRSYTKEEDEVLDFSDADKSSTYRPFNEPIKTTESTVFTRSTTEPYLNEISTNLPLETEKNESLNLIKRIPTPNALALDLNNGLKLSNASVLQDIEAIDESSTEDTTESDDYFPFNTGEDEEDAKLKATASPYGQGVKPENSTPISIPQDPPISSRFNNLSFNTTAPADSLLPPFKISLLNKEDESNSTVNDEYLQSAHSQSFVSHSNSITSNRHGKTFNINDNTYSTTTDLPDRDTTIYTTTTALPFYSTTYSPESTTLYEPETTTRQETTTTEIPTTSTTFEPTVTTHQTTTFIPQDYSTISETTTTLYDQTTQSKAVPNNHWSTSPEVTKLWESTLYVDPLIINRNLGESESSSYTDINTPTTYRPEFSTQPYRTTTEDYIDESVVDLKFTSTTEEPITSTVPSTTYQPIEPNELYTTVIDLGIHSLLNSTELEIASSQAKQIFGNLNSTEQDLLIEKMKEAESNSTVRRLILLLVSTCDASLSNNKTVQETRNSILHALLNVPSNNIPENVEINSRSGKQFNIDEIKIETTTFTPETTTYIQQKFSRKASAIVSNVEVPNKTVDVKDVNEDTRALELLRSLYSLAAKWGKK